MDLSETARVQIFALPPRSYVTLGKIHNFPKPKFPHLYHEDALSHGDIPRSERADPGKALLTFHKLFFALPRGPLITPQLGLWLQSG